MLKTMVKPHENIGKPQQSTKIHGIHCHGGTEVMLGTNDAWHRNGEPKKVAEASPKHRSGRVRKGPEGSGRVRKGPEGSGRVRKGPEGSGRVRKGPEGSGRVRKGPEGSG